MVVLLYKKPLLTIAVFLLMGVLILLPSLYVASKKLTEGMAVQYLRQYVHLMSQSKTGWPEEPSDVYLHPSWYGEQVYDTSAWRFLTKDQSRAGLGFERESLAHFERYGRVMDFYKSGYDSGQYVLRYGFRVRKEGGWQGIGFVKVWVHRNQESLFRTMVLSLSVFFAFLLLSVRFVWSLIKMVNRQLDARRSRYQEKSLLLESVNKYTQLIKGLIPDEVFYLLNKKDIADISPGDATSLQLTILMLDIRGFTSLSEKAGVEETFAFLNQFIAYVEKPVTKNYGYIDKYMGDAVLAVFYICPEDAVLAAIEIQDAIKSFNATRLKDGYSEIRVGVGIHMGEVLLGVVGVQNRMEATVIGDTVNVTSRLQGLTKYYSSSIIISEQVYVGIQNRDLFVFQRLGDVQVRGRKGSVNIYKVLR